MSTLQEKLARLGEAMAVHRLEARLKCRVIERRDDNGKPSYQVQFLNEDGTTKAVQPTAEWAWRFQSVLFGLANELTGTVSDLATGIKSAEARAEVAIERATNQFKAGYEDGVVDGGILERTRLLEIIERRKSEVKAEIDKAWRPAFPAKSLINALNKELRRLDQLAVDFADGPSTPLREEADAIGATPQR